MRKTAQLILFFSLFLLLSLLTVKAQPTLLINTTNISGNYDPAFVYEFNSTWTNSSEDENITSCNFTLGRPNGDVTIYQVTPNSTIPPTLCSITFTQNSLGSTGNYNWTWSAKNDTDWVTNDTFVFTLNNASNPIHLYLNMTLDANITYTYPQAVNATATSAGGTVYLYRNLSHIINGTSPQSELILLGNGTYNYTVNATGNQNYSDNSSSIVYYAFVNKGIPFVTLYINGGGLNKIVNLNEMINLTAASNALELNVTLNLNFTGYLDNFQNGTSPQTNLSNTSSLGVGFFNFSAQVTGNENYSNSSLSSLYFYIANILTTPALPVNYTRNAIYNFSIKLPLNVSNVIFEADFNDALINYTNFTNATKWNITMYNDSNGTYWINFTDLSAKTYYYRWILNDTNNVNFSTNNLTYTINKLQVIPTFSASGGWSTTTSTDVKLTCGNPSYPVSFTFSGSCLLTVGNPATCNLTTPSSSSYSLYECYIQNDTTNYSSHTIGNLSYTSVEYITSTPPPSGSFTLSPSVTSITLEPNSSGTITLTLKNTYSYNITKINITVSGIDASWYSLSKVNISVLQKNGTDTSILTLTIPGDAERKNYTIIASAVGKDPSGYKLTRQSSIKLIIPEIPQNVTNETNETELLNITGIGNQTNQTNVTGLLINLEGIKDYIVLIIALVSIILIFIFRGEFTDFLRGKKPEAHPEHKIHEEKITEEQIHKEPKKIHRVFSHVKKKISSLSEHSLVIQVKKKEKPKEEKKEEKV